MTLEGMRSTITVVTEGEKDPYMMGFRFEGENPDDPLLEAQEDPGDAVLRCT